MLKVTIVTDDFEEDVIENVKRIKGDTAFDLFTNKLTIVTNDNKTKSIPMYKIYNFTIEEMEEKKNEKEKNIG